MSQELSMISNTLPDYLQGVESAVMSDLTQGVGQGGNRISLKGSRFRLVVNGVEESVVEASYIDVVLLGAAPAISRQYFAGAYKPGTNEPPTCYSADGVAPADDVKTPQSDKCMTCPHNVKGSRIVNGISAKECSYFRRLVITLIDDPTQTVFKLDVKGMGLFGEKSADGKATNLNDFVKMLATRGFNAGTIVTRISFDTDAAVPKLLFRPVRYVSEQEFSVVQGLVESAEVEQMRQVTMATVDTSHEEATSDDEEPAAPKPAARPAPKPAARPAPKPAARPAPKPAAKPVKPTQEVEEEIAAVEAEADEAEVVSSDAELEGILSGLE